MSGRTAERVTLIRRALRNTRGLLLVAPALAVCAGMWFAAPTAGFGGLPRLAASDPPVAAWTELGPDGAQSVRAVIASGGCPEMQWVAVGRLHQKSMTVRALPTVNGAFTDTVCQFTLPDGATRADVAGVVVPVNRATLERAAVLGDTGCKITKTKQQACDDPNAWPFATIATKIAAEHPDLILHVGDLLYRKTKCVTTRCDTSPFGLTSASGASSGALFALDACSGAQGDCSRRSRSRVSCGAAPSGSGRWPITSACGGTLGITSLIFEGVVVLISGRMLSALAAHRSPGRHGRSPLST
ncbi:MAG: hypothetical protein JO262_07965 [Solirubrobacterales bacterium]|nr:hypothetical protein [Solirubrobacterales bacterium]